MPHTPRYQPGVQVTVVTHACICMHITVLQSCKVQHGECMVLMLFCVGIAITMLSITKLLTMTCDFLILCCGQTACNTNYMMMCTGVQVQNWLYADTLISNGQHTLIHVFVCTLIYTLIQSCICVHNAFV